MQNMVVCLYANFDRDHLMLWCTRLWLTSRNQVGPWPSNGIFEEIGEEGSRDDCDYEAEERNVGCVKGGSKGYGPDDQDNERESCGVDEEPDWRLVVSEGPKIGAKGQTY